MSAEVAHRLRLTAVEWAALTRMAAVPAPPGFVPDEQTESALRTAAVGLVSRRVTTGAGADALAGSPVPAVAVNLAVLAAPAAAVRVEAALSGTALRACYGITGRLGASLFALPDGAVEVSMFPAERLGVELIRAVPPISAASSPALSFAALAGAAPGLSGRVPLAALGEVARLRRFGVDLAGATPGLTDPQRLLVGQVADQVVGSLWCLVTGAAPASAALANDATNATSGAVLVGQVVWLATADGWVGVQPEPAPGTGGDREALWVRLEPVTAGDLGVWLAPFLAEILEVAGERT